MLISDRDLGLTRAESESVERAVAFANDFVAPNATGWEAGSSDPRGTGAFVRAADAGLTSLLLPRELGGRELTLTAIARVYEELTKACFAFTFGLLVHNNVVGALGRHAQPPLRDSWLPALIEGSGIGAFCLTESSAGSDAAAIRCSAIRQEAGWRITGEKAWVTNGSIASHLMVFAQTDTARGARGIVSFIVPAEVAGVERLAPYDLIGGRAMGAAGFRFVDCRIEDTSMLAEPGKGFRMAMEGIDRARMFIAAMCCGMMRSALDTAVHRLKTRSAFGALTSSFQGLRWLAADAATDLEAARALTFAVARRLDEGQPSSSQVAHAKKFATRAALRTVRDCMELMGAEGLRASLPLARHLAHAKIAEYLDGTTEIQNVVISRDLLGDR